MQDVFGLGNAIVDVEINVDDSFLTAQQIPKGHMTLVDTERMRSLLQELDGQPMNRCSGGSAANTIFALQSFGLQTSYNCKVASDASGHYFVDEMTRAGVVLNTNAMSEQGTTGQCLVLISRDAERTMNTDLGISSELSEPELNLDQLRASKYYYVEGYLSSSPASTAAAIACREAAEAAGVKVAVSLSDPSMVEFFRDALQQILGNGVTQVFCNEEEAMSWARTDRLDVAIAELKDIAPELYVTLGAQGSMAVSPEGKRTADGFAAKAVDTTGAGDIYAGACLAARCAGAAPVDAARFANYCAAHLVSEYGARLKSSAQYKSLQAHYSG